jgi:uncharacterized membrane protein YeaQ/YmgE (transglycosylase-associated protein family)
MHLSNESLIVIIIVGIVAGWLAGNIVRGGGYGLIGDLVVGIIGAFIGDRLVPRLGIHLGAGMIALIVNATLGAIVLLIILRLISGAGGGVAWSFGRSLVIIFVTDERQETPRRRSQTRQVIRVRWHPVAGD